MKRADLVAGEVYVKASPHYGNYSYGSRNLNGEQAELLDSGRWEDRRGSFYRERETTQRVLENGERVTLNVGIKPVPEGKKVDRFYKNGVLCRVKAWHGTHIAVVPLNMLRCTWAEHEKNVADDKAAREKAREDDQKRSNLYAAQYRQMAHLIEAEGIPGKLKGEGYSHYSRPELTLDFAQFMELMKKLGAVLTVEDQS